MVRIFYTETTLSVSGLNVTIDLPNGTDMSPCELLTTVAALFESKDLALKGNESAENHARLLADRLGIDNPERVKTHYKT